MGYRDSKNPWHMLFDKFCKKCPNISKQVKSWRPFIYPVIDIRLNDGTRMIYNDDTGRSDFVKTDEDIYRIIF